MTYQPDLFDLLVIAGNEMIHALEAGDLDGFASALDARADLVERLKKTDAPAAVRNDWQSVAAVVSEQDGRILAIARRVQDSLTEQIAQTSRMGHAARQYGSGAPQTGLMTASLSG